MRPAATGLGFKAPVIMDASPYTRHWPRQRGRVGETGDGDGLLDRWPLFYDNYFVPCGYAVVLLDMVGTSNLGQAVPSRAAGRPPERRRRHRLAERSEEGLRQERQRGVVAAWHNGQTGMIGKPYDGTLANGAASTGVEGLSTIVPISAISSWYDYTRSNGVVTRGNSYPSFLSNTVTNPDRRAHRAAVRATLAMTDGDESGDYTPFWAERDYNPDAGSAQASVFVVHGLQDDNVMPDHFSK